MFSWLEKKIFQKNLEKNGILIGEIENEKKSSRILLILLKAGLIFIAAYCSVIGLLDTFNIPFSRGALIVAFLGASIYFGMVYAHRIFFYLGYIFFSFGFLIYIVRFYAEANSGFQAIINIVYEDYSDYFNLMSIREGQELIQNRYYTVSIAALFFGIFLIMLLNITISGYMNVLETILITFPIIEIALYINKIPNILYLIGLCFVYISVAILQFSRHSRLQVKSKNTHEFTRFIRKNKFYYFYQADIRIFITTFIMSAILSTVLCFSLYSVSSKETSKVPTNAIHKQANEYIKTFIQSGFMAFLDKYESTGGLSNGRLGGVSQVRPDFETDLTVTYAPNNYETIYLKGYTGNLYTFNNWHTDFVVGEESEDKLYIFNENIQEIENTRIYPFETEARMHIKHEDYDFTNYIPYFSGYGDVNNVNTTENSYEVIYHPMSYRSEFDEVHEDNLLENDEYYTYVYDYCLSTPDELKDTLLDNLSLMNIEPKESLTNEERLNYARSIYSYYFDNFSYTMAPGSTPRNRDFVEYFLNDQQRGFCAHFASAEVLLLRQAGVPARYCEGYVIPISLVSESAAATEFSYDAFYSGYNMLEENVVIEVPVNDSYAHAWVEIYLDGYGFVPFEATIPSFDEDNNNLFPDLAGLFAFLTNNQNNGTILNNNENNAINNVTGGFNLLSNIASYTGPVSRIVIIFFAGLAAAISLYFLIKLLILRIKLLYYKKHNDEYHLVEYEYQALTRKLTRRKYITKENPLPCDVKEAYNHYIEDYNNKHKKKMNINTEELFEYYERIMYS